MTVPAPGLYQGQVVHTRMKPVRHRLSYRVFYLLLDIDAPARGLRFLSHNGFNLFGYFDRDHGAGGPDLRQWVESEMAATGLSAPRHIRLLTLPRVLGYVFNPVSLYFCYDGDERLEAVIYEVNNTFGERHSYLVRAGGRSRLQHDCPKRFYVSPFNEVAGGYTMDLIPPSGEADGAQVGDAIVYRIHQRDEDGPLLFAGLDLTGQALTDRALLGRFIAMPLMTVKVIAAIHWEAFKLWRKGLRLKTRPAPPDPDVTVLTDTP